MSRLERDVRTMLHRRAADIEGAAVSARSASPIRPGQVVAAVAALAIGGLVTYLLVNNGSTLEVSTQPAPVTTIALDADPADPGDPPDLPLPPPAPTDWRALLPAGFVPETASTVFAVEATQGDDPITPTDAALRYLRDRAPVLAESSADRSLVATLVEDGPLLDAIHIASGHDGQWTETVVVVRSFEMNRHEIVASSDAGLDATTVRRTPTGIEGLVENDRLDGLAADVLSLDRVVLDTSPNPAGVTGESPVFGTAGWEDGRLPDEAAGELTIDVPVDPERTDPLIVMLRHVGGAELSITEFALRPVSLAGLCSTDQRPDISLGLGEWFGALDDGPAPGSLWSDIDGQQRSHGEGDFGSIEVLWPVSPEWLVLPTVADSGDARSAERHFPGIGDVIIGSGTGPCGWLQISFVGDPSVVEPLATAVAGMYQFTESVDLSTIDLSEVVDPPTTMLDTVVTEGRAATELPSVPLTGSCDGLPDAAPFTGTGPTGRAPSTIEALEAFLATEPLDGMFPRTGYVVLEGPLRTLGYIVDGHSSPVIVIELDQADGGWRVARWEAAAC